MAHERITIDPNRMSGLACIRDTRVTVSAVLGQLAARRSFDDILVGVLVQAGWDDRVLDGVSQDAPA